MERASARQLPDGRRLHLSHGPIDLIIEAFGPGRREAYAAAERRFETVLDELVAELPALRQAVGDAPSVRGPVAARMVAATVPFQPAFVTPMASVAGAVADEVLACMVSEADVTKAYVNNGGDIAFDLAPGETLDTVVAAQGAARIRIRAEDPIRGIATSGWRGRSHSLGIADSVTVLASTAATADAAATLIANAVDLPGDPRIGRQPAVELWPDSDLGDRLVTTAVPLLSDIDCATALARGVQRAQGYLDRGIIFGAFLALQGATRALGQTTIELAAQSEITHA